LLNIAFVAAVGVVSGHYIFKQPLEDYWTEQQGQQQQLGAFEGGAVSDKGAADSRK